MQIRPTFTKRQMRSALRAKLLACLFPFVLSSYVPAGAAIVIAAPSSDAAVSLQSKYAALRDKLILQRFIKRRDFRPWVSGEGESEETHRGSDQ